MAKTTGTAKTDRTRRAGEAALVYINRMLREGRSPWPIPPFVPKLPGADLGPLTVSTPRWFSGAIDLGQIALEGAYQNAMPAMPENGFPRDFNGGEGWRYRHGLVKGTPPVTTDLRDELVGAMVRTAHRLCEGLPFGALVTLNFEPQEPAHGMMTSERQMTRQNLTVAGCVDMYEAVMYTAAGLDDRRGRYPIRDAYTEAITAFCEVVRSFGCLPAMFRPDWMDPKHAELVDVWVYGVYARASDRRGRADYRAEIDEKTRLAIQARAAGKRAHLLLSLQYQSNHPRAGEMLDKADMLGWVEAVREIQTGAGLKPLMDQRDSHLLGGSCGIGIWTHTREDRLRREAALIGDWAREVGPVWGLGEGGG